MLQLSSLPGIDPLAVYLTWQRDPTTSMTIQWLSNLQDTKDTLFYRSALENDWKKAEGSHERLPQRYPYYVHRVELLHLQPDTEYLFRIGNSFDEKKFRTLPHQLKDGVRFVVGGDMYQGSHQTTELLEKTNRLAAATNPNFILLGGDLAYSAKHFWFASEDGNRWITWLKSWSKTMISPSGHLIPFLTAIGNHEVNGRFNQTPSQAAFYYTLFPTPGYQNLDFGNYMTLFILDSGHTHSIKGEQSYWLEEVLKRKKDHPFKVALYHVPAYPSHGSLNFKQSIMIRKHWVPLFDQYGLNVAFEHHCHTYKRTYPLKGGLIEPKGVVYLGDGAWAVKKTRKPHTIAQYPFIAQSSSANHFLLIDLTPQYRRYRALTTEGAVIDDYRENLH